MAYLLLLISAVIRTIMLIDVLESYHAKYT